MQVAGLTLVPAGLIFVLRFWEPTSGPYLANEKYPFGSHLNAWAVSFGFTWIAFGVLFAAAARWLHSISPRRAWWVLMVTWLITWFPHATIGIAVAWQGLDRRSVDTYSRWAESGWGAAILAIDSLLLVVHVASAVAGFVLTRQRRVVSTTR